MPDKKQLKKELKDEKALLQCAKQFGLVGDPTRMKICWLLCKYQELSVGEIAELLDVSISVVSHSLRRLRKHNLVNTRRDYKQVFYSLSNANFNQLLKRSITNL